MQTIRAMADVPLEPHAHRYAIQRFRDEPQL